MKLINLAILISFLGLLGCLVTCGYQLANEPEKVWTVDQQCQFHGKWAVWPESGDCE